MAMSRMPGCLPASLLLGHVTDHGQLEHLSLISLEHQNQPDHKSGQTEQWPQQHCGPAEEWNVTNECQADPEHGPCDRKEEALKRVEADEALPVERFQHQKHNCGDNGHVGERASNVIGESGGRRCSANLPDAASTLRTGCSIRDLCSTGWTKSHRASFERREASYQNVRRDAMAMPTKASSRNAKAA